MALNVRLGQGYFEYRWSPVRHLRSTRMLVVLLVVGVACWSVWWLAQGERRLRRAGAVLFALTLLLAGAWAWWAPPNPLNQQFFNARSFSTDGAFVFEAEKIEAAGTYLRRFGEVLRQTPAELGGTRVLSNPPGTTMLAYALRRAFPPNAHGWMERLLVDAQYARPHEAAEFGPPLRFSIALMLMWMLSGGLAYGLGRVFLSPAGAAVFAIMLTFNPCTIHFVPGKDPGQLLTINAMLWAWFAGWKRGSWLLSALAGALLVVGSVFGLVHIWIALAALAATIWQDLRLPRDAKQRVARTIARYVLAAAMGAAAVVVAAYVLIGWNIPSTLMAVSSRWGELQKTFDMNRPIWFIIGLPIFLLFLTPGTWALASLSLRRRRLNLGSRLALCTAGIMLLIYFGMGVTYELPRLWVAFLPTLLLGLALDSPLLRSRGFHRRIAQALVLIVCVQMVFTAFHWTLFDAREAEYRLLTQRYFD